MCRAQADVRQVPIADIGEAKVFDLMSLSLMFENVLVFPITQFYVASA